MVAGAFSGALGGLPLEGVIAKTLSPEINHQIKQATEKDPTANAIAHGVWSALETYTAGGNALSGAVAGISAETLAPIIAEKIYGKDTALLTDEEKQNVINLASLSGGIANCLTIYSFSSDNVYARSFSN